MLSTRPKRCIHKMISMHELNEIVIIMCDFGDAPRIGESFKLRYLSIFARYTCYIS